MLEKLLSLLLHAKGGAIATVLVIGASGALVTATVENGTTTVNDAYKTDHAAILALSKDAPKTSEARDLVKAADATVKDFRQEGVKDIHDLFKSDECKGSDDEDSDVDVNTDDEDTSTVAISCSDAKACADAAIAEMDKVVEQLKADLEKLEAAPATTNTTTTSGNKPDKSDRDSHDNKGKGKGRG